MTETTPKPTFKQHLSSAVTETGGRVPSILSNVAIGLAYTTADLAESKIFRAVSGWVFDGKAQRLEKELHQAVTERNTHVADQTSMDPQKKEQQKIADELQIQIIRDALRVHEGVHGASEYVEEWVSDVGITKGGQKIIDKHITEFKDAQLDDSNTIGEQEWEKSRKHLNTYVKPFAENLSDYANAIMQVFLGDKWIGWVDKDGKPKEFMGMYMAEKSMNFVNPGNVEATLRVLSNIPLIDKPVKWVKDSMDRVLEHSALATLANAGFNKALLGFHIVNSRIKAVDKATAEIASKTA